MFRHWRHRRQCSKLAQRSSNSGLITYIKSCADLKAHELIDTPIISVDLELTGLDVKQNQIIAIGWTLIDHGKIQLGSNRHILINAQQSVGASAAIHELTDSEIANGIPIEEGLQALFESARKRVWLFHHARLDVAFLQQACLAWAAVRPPMVVLDTMQMELALRKRRDLPVSHGDLQLGRLRRSYKLPRYTSHHALIDAGATAELLLAIASRMEPSRSLRLNPYLRYY